MSAFSLPTQRCFSPPSRNSCGVSLFSAYAEVFPTTKIGQTDAGAFLCLRRGVSPAGACVFSVSLFSLPTQRCF